MKYSFVKRLGEGAQGDCFLVKERSSNEECVIKRIAMKDLDYNMRRAARQEAEILESLNHPNVI